ncbi:MAG: DNA polymerase III subunit gamma/tau [Elusimicrobiota bacterium]
MAYLILARKYRPQRFDEVIGQQHITQTLKNAITQNHLTHGYIFSGQRGVGKTTTARIFAKALNCKNDSSKKHSEPCNQCEICQAIMRGSSMDVIEIDAASNRGIDEIRTLREDVKFAPSSTKYKVYIIDEAHQITEPAFNALLKTLEEPPAHVIFIFATTSTQKIPPTILSRCQRYNFRQLSIAEISQQLIKIGEQENIKIDEQAIALIAHAAGGALRDALSIFDHVISFCGDNITSQNVISILGIVREDLLAEMFESIQQNDTKKLLQLANTAISLGYDPQSIVSGLQEYIRNIILYKVSPELVLTISDTKKLKLFSTNCSTEVLLRYINMLSNCVYEMRNAEQPSMILEVYCVKLTQKYIGLDELTSRLEILETSSVKPLEKKSPILTEINISDITVEKVRSAWNEILKEGERGKIKPRIVGCMTGSQIVTGDNGGFIIEFEDNYKMETVVKNKNLWLPELESKLGNRFEFTTRLKPINNIESENEELELPAIPPLATIEDEQVQSEHAHQQIEEVKQLANSKKSKKVDELFEKEPAVKMVVDIFDGKIAEGGEGGGEGVDD